MRYPAARLANSPNFGPRQGCEVECIVIHHISLPPHQFGGGHVEEFFQNRLDPAAHPYFAEVAHMRVSAHFLIDREGEVIQFVDTGKAAWHAGISSWRGREGVNRFSVGIELEGDEIAPYTDFQYEALAKLIGWIMEAHPKVKPDAVVGHEHVSPGRKRDPGPNFDWERLKASITRG